jgi:hypothetical protein
MADTPAPINVLSEAQRILKLSRTDKRAAEQALAALPLPVQVAIVCEAPVASRAKVLGMLPEPEAAIPMLPEGELVFTVKAVGLDDATWILEHSTPRQLATCFDLDAWKGLDPDRTSIAHWFAVLAEAGDETLLRATHAIDPEVLSLYIRSQVLVMLDPDDDEWQAPIGAQTLEGQFYFMAKKEGDDIAPLMRLLHVLFSEDYWLYFRMMQGVMWELETELEESSLRWRTGRLADLGFPSWEDSMRIYGHLRPELRTVLAEHATVAPVGDWDLAVWLPNLPSLTKNDHSIFSAVQELDEHNRRVFFYSFVSLANKIAVADRMPLGDAETLPKTIEKAAVIASKGLEHLATANATSLSDVLGRTTLEYIFRVGASLDPETALPTPLPTNDKSESDKSESDESESEEGGADEAGPSVITYR